METPPLILAVYVAFYLVTSRLVMRALRGGLREVVMALLNIAGVCFLICHNRDGTTTIGLKIVLYAGIVVIQYGLLALFSGAGGWRLGLAFFAPIAALIALHYTPGQVFVSLGHVFGKELHRTPNIIGISYFAFRCSRLVLEVRIGSVKKPGFWQYLNFAFFLPTMSVGPINTYANHRRGFDAAAWEVPVGRAALRVLVGLIKSQFLGGVFGQLTYSNFLLNGHPHDWIALPIVMAFYSLYLYCNFSGFCDMAIGAAAFIGIPVLENFNNPFAARNMKEFWNRWHITLSQWMRDLVFAPLSKFLVRVMGPTRVNHAIALTILVVFLLVGIWHGVGWNFVIFGALQALGVIANHYYTLGLKQWLGRDGFKAYNANRWIHAAAVVLTFGYWSASLLFFANTLPQIKEIFHTLR